MLILYKNAQKKLVTRNYHSLQYTGQSLSSLSPLFVPLPLVPLPPPPPPSPPSPDHPYFVGVQFHPEYLTRPMSPSPPYLGFIMAACNKLQGYLTRNCQLSPRASYDYDSEHDDEVTQAFSRMSASTSPLHVTPLVSTQTKD